MWSITHKFKDSFEKGRPHISLTTKSNEGDNLQKKKINVHELIFKSYSNHRKAKVIQVNTPSPSSANFAVQGYNISSQVQSPAKNQSHKIPSIHENIKHNLTSNEGEKTKSKETSSEMSTSLLSNLVLQKLLKNKVTSEEPKKAVVVHEEDEQEDYSEGLRPSRLGMRPPEDISSNEKVDSDKIKNSSNSILRNSYLQEHRPTTCGDTTNILQNKPLTHMKRPMTSRERPLISRDRDGWGDKPKTNEQSSSISVWEKRRRLTLQSLNTSFQSSYLQEQRQAYSKPSPNENSLSMKDPQSFHKQYYYETNAPVWQPTSRFPMNMPIKTKRCKLKKENYIDNVILQQKIITYNQNKNQIGALTFYAQPDNISPRGVYNSNSNQNYDNLSNNQSINKGIPFIYGLNGVKYRSFSTRNSIHSASKALYSQNLGLQHEESEGISEQIKTFLKFTCRDRLSPVFNLQSEQQTSQTESFQSHNHKIEANSPSQKSSIPSNANLGSSTLTSPLSSYLIKQNNKQQSTLSSSIAVDIEKESSNQSKDSKNQIFISTKNKKSPSEILTKPNLSPQKTSNNHSTPQKVSKSYQRIQDKYPLRIQSAHYVSSSEHTNCFPQPARINPHVLFQQASSGSKEFKPSNSLTISNSSTSPRQIKKFEFIQVRY